MKKILLLFLLISSVSFGQSTLLVPTQYSTIQNAIDAAASGDTVLVDPGVYYEGINLNGKSIIVASKYLTTNDTSYISATIINGTNLVNQDIILIENGEDSTTLISGFTLTGAIYTTWGRSGVLVANGTGNAPSSCTLDHLIIDSIYSDGQGPAVFINGNSNVIINKCTMTNNFSGVNGGAIYIENSNVSINNCDIQHNQSNIDGGGIFITSANVNIDSCNISNNTCFLGGNGGHGGGVKIEHFVNGPSYVNISNCMITNNSANTGGGIYTAESYDTISYTEITNNHASGDGGGITCSQSYPNIINVTLSNNSAPNGEDLLVAHGSNMSVLNTIVWSPIGTIGSPTITVDYSNINGGYSGTGNLNSYPVYVDSTNGDFHLQGSSPCIDAGNPSAIYNDPNGTRNDIGAYPYDACAGATITGTDIQSACDSYTWIDGNTYTANNNTATYTLTNPAGCDSVVTLDLTINSSPIIDLGPDTTFCSGTNYILDAGSGFASYLWSDGSTNSTLTVTNTGTYWVEVTNSSGCTSNIDTVIIYQGILNVDAGQTQTVCLGCADIPNDSATLVATGAQSYVWDNGVTNGIAFSPLSTALYTVTGTDANGCSGTDTVTVFVGTRDCASFSLTGLDSVVFNNQTYYQTTLDTIVHINVSGCDSIEYLDIIINHTGISENILKDVGLYPNPTSDVITLKGINSLTDVSYIHLLDNKGALLRKIGINETQLDLSLFSTGIYFIEIKHQLGSGRIKVIKQ